MWTSLHGKLRAFHILFRGRAIQIRHFPGHHSDSRCVRGHNQRCIEMQAQRINGARNCGTRAFQ
ncbi:hypothetical protein [Nitrosomonas sp. Nm166]|uniref:hypothetical protein n=1 Tax=Nitrosomonas sp. Nm166 TaxID=1881054 RepID=UPI0011605DF7|nr:hypothetical protein [Nitrosomonas sp. Nm166]